MTILAIKAAVRARDDFRCVECGMTNQQHLEAFGKSLEVHRITPGSPYTLDGCVTLCLSCHGSKPRRQRGQPDLAYERTSLYFWLDQVLSDALDAYLASLKPRPTTTAALVLFIEECLQRRGFLPPPSP